MDAIPGAVAQLTEVPFYYLRFYGSIPPLETTPKPLKIKEFILSTLQGIHAFVENGPDL